MNTQTAIFKSELLTDTADMIKAAGFKVYWSRWSDDTRKATYFHFTDGTNIGYCQEGYFGGIRFSTVHKPCRECGTGFGLTDDPGIYSPTIEDAKQAFIIAPNWAKINDLKAVKKYANWQEFVKSPIHSMPEYIEY